MLYRQGDVLIEKINSSIPKGAKLIDAVEDAVVLAWGESTGHKHQLISKTTSLYEWQGDRLLQVSEPSLLKHEEHATITLPKGTYKITQQREYSPEAIRNVRD